MRVAAESRTTVGKHTESRTKEAGPRTLHNPPPTHQHLSMETIINAGKWKITTTIISIPYTFHFRLPCQKANGSNGSSKELHLVGEVLRICGHIHHANHIQLGSKQVLVANGLAETRQVSEKITSRVPETVGKI